MPEIQIPSIVITGLQLILAFVGAFLVALWLSMIVWTFRDARARSRDIFAILLATLMAVVFGPLGVLLYFLLRPPVTLAELYERSLEEEALLQDLEERPRCPGCSRQVKDEWILCPDCHTTLKNICYNCQNALHLGWTMCPFCGVQVNQSTTDHDHHDSSGQVVEAEPQPEKPDTKPVEHDYSPPQPADEPPATPPHGDETRPQIPEAGPA
jgi:hypothetical protein